MAGAADLEPTPEQMVREMQSAGFHPGGEAPQPTELSPDQMIKEMQAGGYHPQLAEQGGLMGFLNHQYGAGSPAAAPISEADQFADAAKGMTAAATTPEVAGQIGGMAGTLLPVPGGAEAGAGLAAGASSAARDMIDNFVSGKNKSTEDIATDAAKEGGTAAAAQLAGGLLFKGVGKVLGKVAEHIIPESVLKRYSEAAETVMKLHGETDGNVAEAADQVKQGLQHSLDEFRGNMNQQISTALKDSRATVDTKSVMRALEDAKANLHPTIDAGDAAKLSEVESMIKQLDGYPEAGKMTVQDANALKRKLQDMATSAYRNPGESSGGGKFAEAVKSVAAKTRTAINEAAPELKAVNERLSELHNIEDSMNKGLIQSGKSESPLIAAGKYTPGKTGGNARNYEALRKLGEITGKDFISPAQDLAAVQTLGNAKPSLSPAENIPFAIRKGMDFAKTPAANTLGAVMPQPIGRAINNTALTLGQMYGSGAANSLQDMSKQNGF